MTVIPAQPGFLARWKHAGKTFEEPIIAWLIEPKAINPRPKPIGVWGWCDDKADIIAPDGKVVKA